MLAVTRGNSEVFRYMLDKLMLRWVVKGISALGRSLFIYSFDYFNIYLARLFTLLGNSSFYMRTMKNNHVIANLYLQSSEVDS